ncbi:MAG: hypothetical protein CMD33_00270 [Flavobacteriales bacterium]|nr:hypothetical protein [Flavobacteriales bacterium]
MKNISHLILVFLLGFCGSLFAQTEVTVDNYSANLFGQVQLSIQGSTDKYYILQAQHSPDFEWPASMTLGSDGTMVISAPGAAYPLDQYSIWEYDLANPGDIDGDGIDDLTEYNTMPTDAPLNYAEAVDFYDGATSIPDAETFMALATVNNVGWAPFLDDQLYVKFGILNRDSPNPQVYFINSNTHTVHYGFWSAIDADVTGDDSSGEIVFNPTQINPNGVIGGYSFNFSFGDAYDFEATQRTYQLLMANMPFIQNNMNHFIGENDEDDYLEDYADDYEDSGIDVVLESEVFGNVDYIPLHLAEGYGFFKHMEVDETPGSRDIVLYDALPNSLPRVGGIMTSVIQTPLSHVNLRAIQDNVPNAYIADPISIDSIAELLGNYIYYRVEADSYFIREATLDEVNEWYEALRPTEPQIPERDLSFTEILPLDDIGFEMSSAFGAKCSNVATMRSFGFPEGTIPDGFGIPFYFYDEFMQYNDFYEEADVMINNPSFIYDIDFREDRLRDFRDDIKDAPMPPWMMDALQAMHDSFPVGTAVRCRSSTNNEDLPGFSGAGLYTSKTQHLDEGHISKSIKQVYASMWNFRAYEERDFYRVDHFMAAMGLLCHPNFQEEQSNGVGISLDPIYNTEGTFYLNTQVGESLITNPEPNAVPEEILLYEDPDEGAGYVVLRLSNLVEDGDLVMDTEYLDLMREYLSTIHDEFAVLYGVEGIEGFGMDIEYKVTAQDALAIKQARPWVSFWAGIKADDDLAVEELVEPVASSDLSASETVTLRVANTGLNDMSDFDLSLLVDGELMETMNVQGTIAPFGDSLLQFTTTQDFSSPGEYLITGIVSDPEDGYGNNDTLDFVLSHLHNVDGALSIAQVNTTCDGQVSVSMVISNLGAEVISSVDVLILINGEVMEVLEESVEIASQDQGSLSFFIDDDMLASTNTIQLALTSVNGVTDGNADNNAATATADLEASFENLTLYFLADDWPSETSWKLVDVGSGQTLSEGDLGSGADEYSEAVCVNSDACLMLYVFDSFGDGMCCGYGQGNFQVWNSEGEIIVYNDGDFGSEAVESFCASESGCQILANIDIDPASSEAASDAVLTIETLSNDDDFVYSIDGGQSFQSSNIFEGLAAGAYQVVVENGAGTCTYAETIVIAVCDFTELEITVTHPYSVLTTDGSIIIAPTSAEGSYLYSIDGGQNFEATGVFMNLPVGEYNVVVTDNLSSCVYEFERLLIPSGVVAVEEQASITPVIRVFPNPTNNQLSIELAAPNTLNQALQYVLFDRLGRVLDTGRIERGSTLETISLGGYAPGTYFVKCLGEDFEQNFKVIKM